jgi:hypothetical protein
MTPRLTAEREAQIREWASVVASNWGRENYDDLLAELDAVRAERDTIKTRLVNSRQHLIETMLRADRAEAMLAAIRARFQADVSTTLWDMRDLLDAAPKDTP